MNGDAGKMATTAAVYPAGAEAIITGGMAGLTLVGPHPPQATHLTVVPAIPTAVPVVAAATATNDYTVMNGCTISSSSSNTSTITANSSNNNNNHNNSSNEPAAGDYYGDASASSTVVTTNNSSSAVNNNNSSSSSPQNQSSTGAIAGAQVNATTSTTSDSSSTDYSGMPLDQLKQQLQTQLDYYFSR